MHLKTNKFQFVPFNHNVFGGCLMVPNHNLIESKEPHTFNFVKEGETLILSSTTEEAGWDPGETQFKVFGY